MAYETDFTLPQLGDGDSGGRVIRWHKRPGESFVRKDVLLEVETDKALVEVPARADGVMVRHLVDVDAVVAYRDPIARLEFEGSAPPDRRTGTASDQSAGKRIATKDRVGTDPGRTQARTEGGDSVAASDSESDARPSIPGNVGDDSTRVVASPWARTLAKERRVDLSTITGSGKRGRIIGRDVPEVDVRAERFTSRFTVESGQDVILDVEDHLIDTPDGAVFARIWNPSERRVAATAVLLHGVFGDVDTWAALAAALARRGVRVVAVDLPCHGQSPASTTEFREVVATLVGALRSVTEGPLALVGHSFGGAVAARVAHACGIELHSLVLLAPAGLGTAIDQSFLDGMIHARTREALAREMRKLGDSLPRPGETWLNEALERLDARSDSLARLCASIARSGIQQIDIMGDIEPIANELPVRILQGKSDRIVPWMQVLDSPPRVSLHLVSGVGHMPHWEASSLTTELLLDTLGVKP